MITTPQGGSGDDPYPYIPLHTPTHPSIPLYTPGLVHYLVFVYRTDDFNPSAYKALRQVSGQGASGDPALLHCSWTRKETGCYMTELGAKCQAFS